MWPPREGAHTGAPVHGRIRRAGSVEIIAPWVNPDTKRSAAISNERLAQLADEFLPVSVKGGPVLFQVNRNRTGWVVELVNNAGMKKKPGEPAVVDPTAVAVVNVLPRLPLRAAMEWRSNEELPIAPVITARIPPGETAFVELKSD